MLDIMSDVDSSQHGIAPPISKGSTAKRKRLSSPGSGSQTPGLTERRASEDQPQSEPQSDGQNGKLVSRKKGRPSLRKEPSKAVECVVEWPAFFKTLEKTHRALNLVWTFCCTRRHLITTFDTIKATVETHIKRSIEIDEVAMIVALRPEGINFAYVDELMLQLDVRGAERDDTFRGSKSARSQAPASDASVGGYTGNERLGDEHSGQSEREVLYFEFIDGDLKREVQDRTTGEARRPNRKLRDEELKMPVYSQKQMTELIERRNQKFANAISSFLNTCVEEDCEPESTLRDKAQAFVPMPSPPEADAVKQACNTVPESIPKERKSVPEIVQELKDSPWYTGQVVPDGHRVFEPQQPIYGNLDFLLSQNLVNALYNTKGITQFYAHQAEALNSLHEGQHVVVATSTSSGKSLIYQLPVLHALEDDPMTRAMYIFPTKALAQDQKRSLKEMLAYMPGFEDVVVETFDGDTPMNQRNDIREQARIIFTNPDMLHVTILPQEERWRTFLRHLKYVVGMTTLELPRDT